MGCHNSSENARWRLDNRTLKCYDVTNLFLERLLMNNTFSTKAFFGFYYYYFFPKK